MVSWLTAGDTAVTHGGIIVLRGGACAVERAAHLSRFARNALYCAGATATFPSNRQHALTGPQLSLDLLFSGGADLGPSELLASFYRPFKPSADSLADHAALELGEGTCYSELMRGGIYEGSSFDCCAFERGAGWLRTKARAAWATGSSRHPRRTGSDWPNWGTGQSWPSRARRPARAPRRAGSHRPRIAGSSRGENCFL